MTQSRQLLVMSGALWKVHLFILHKEVIILIWHGSLTFLALSCQDSQEESRKNRIASQYLIKYKLHSVKAKYHIGGENYTHTHTHTHFWDVLGLLSAWVFSSSCPEQGLLSRCGRRASHCSGFSCGAWAPGHSVFSSCSTRAQ